MYKPILLISILSMFAFSLLGLNLSAAADGQAVFNSLHCGSCHKPKKKTVGASLSEIAKQYSDGEKLVQFFKGEGKPIIETNKPMIMERQMGKLAALSDEDKMALAEYILGFK
jgi:cytochrome c551/c552